MDRIGEEAYWDRELSDVQNKLQSMAWEGKIRPYDAQVLTKLVLLIHEVTQTFLNQPWRNLIDFVRENDSFSGTSPNAVKAFKSLLPARPWMTKEMMSVYIVGAQEQYTVGAHWQASQTFHLLYSLPKTTIYQAIVQNYSHREYRADLDLIDYVQWCLTPDGVSIYLNPSDPRTDRAFDKWSAIANQEPISSLLTFVISMRIMPFDLTTVSPYGKPIYLSDTMSAIDRYVAHILYPHVFGPTPGPKNMNETYFAATLVLDGYGTLDQVKQVLPFSAAPHNQWLMADIMRFALIVERLDVAIYYGFGPNTVQLIDFDQTSFRDDGKRHAQSQHKSWGILDFLGDIPDDMLQRVVQEMQLDPNYAASLIDVVHNG